jgi:hypothetical protein
LEANNFTLIQLEKREAVRLVGYYHLRTRNVITFFPNSEDTIHFQHQAHILQYHIPDILQHDIAHIVHNDIADIVQQIASVVHHGIKQSTGQIQAQITVVDHGKGWMMLWASLDHLCHGVVEDGDLEDVAPHHLEGHEVAYQP